MRKAAEETAVPAAGASGGAIGDNGSTLGGLLVDRLSPIDRSVKTAWLVREKQPNSLKTPPLARRAEPLGTMALHCGPIGRSIVPNRSEREDCLAGEKSSRTALRRLRLRVGRSHWGQWLYTGRRRRLRVGRSHWGQWLYTGRLLWANRLLDRS